MSRKRSLSDDESEHENSNKVAENSTKVNDRKEIKSKALESISKILKVSEKFSDIWNKDVMSVLNEDSQKKKSSLDLRYFKGTLKDYQVVGVKWMESICVNALNGILADEMGLGKTVQVIALLANLLAKGCGGRHLIIVPLSVVTNWESEFKRFAPVFDLVPYIGDQKNRHSLRSKIQAFDKIDDKKKSVVVIVPYHFISSDITFFERLKFNYLIIDEGQKIKNYKSKISSNVRLLRAKNKLLLTGTPLQNNLTELWALLNFVMPQIFSKVEIFETILELEDLQEENFISDETTNKSIITTIHKVIDPFMIRRMKSEVLPEPMAKKEVLVYCPLTVEQRDIYSALIIESLKRDDEKEVVLLNHKRRRVNLFDWMDNSERSDQVRVRVVEQEAPKENNFNMAKHLNNPMMAFRKIVNHPYLLDPKMTENFLIDENHVNKSGKMKVLDALLTRLIANGHKVLIFSSLVIMLTIIEEYMELRGTRYAKLYGSMSMANRQTEIDKFNEDPDIRCFLISTRAGGLGLNLTSADTVIFYDRDWNPHVDAQAQARCHRIGQTKPVMVYTLLTKDTIDERIINFGELKMRLENIIIKKGSKSNSENKNNNELLEMLKVTQNTKTIAPNGAVFTTQELDELLDRSELYS